MSAKHTPAPWTVSGKQVKSIDHGKRYTVATANNPKFTDEANASNARLIAAAPDLLNALLRIQARADYGKDNPRKQTDVLFDILELSRDVIAKAIGDAQ